MGCLTGATTLFSGFKKPSVTCLKKKCLLIQCFQYLLKSYKSVWGGLKHFLEECVGSILFFFGGGREEESGHFEVLEHFG